MHSPTITRTKVLAARSAKVYSACRPPTSISIAETTPESNAQNTTSGCQGFSLPPVASVPSTTAPESAPVTKKRRRYAPE